MKTLKITLLVLSGLLAGLLLAEGLARCILPYPARQISLLRMRAPDLQMDAATNLKTLDYNPFLQRRPDSEWVCDGRNSERMNNEGFRDRDFVINKDPSKFRIAVLGDSFTEGWMAPRGVAFPMIMESKLGSGYEVMNFGMANRSPLRYLTLYDQIVRKYHPDVVLICLYKNDVAEDEALRPYVNFDTYGIPKHFDFARYFRHTPRMPQTKWEKRLDKWQWMLCRYSRIYPYAAVALTVDPEFRKRILEVPPQKDFLVLWANTELYLQRLRDLVKKDNAQFLISYVPDLSDFSSVDPLLEHCSKFTEKIGQPFWNSKPFFSAKNKESLYIPNDGHFSAEGHRLYGQQLTAWMKEQLKVEK